MTGQQHKVRKVVNSGTRLCSFVPKTQNIVISESYTLKTNNARQGVLRIVSKFSPAGIIGLGLVTSTILLEMVIGDRPDDFVEVMPGFKFKLTRAHANRDVGFIIIVQETPQVRFTFGGIQHHYWISIRFLSVQLLSKGFDSRPVSSGLIKSRFI